MEKTIKPLVSVIIPVYNGENYLKEAIDSALAQTYEFVEILVINDGSGDNTEKIALSYGEKIRYFVKDNGGVSTALNMGIANMRGEYFSWLSHDDLYKPEKIEKQISESSGGSAQIVYSDYDVIGKNGEIITTMNVAEKYPDADLTLGLFPVMRQVLNGCSLLIHKSHFDRAGMFDESLRVTQDYDLWFKMFRNEKLVYINEPLVMAREHGSQVTHNYEHNLIESDALWLNMLKNITKEDACKLDGTELDFWDRQSEFLSYTRYKKARQYAKENLKALGGRSKKSVPMKFIKLTAYKFLSGISRITRRLGIQKAIKNGRLFKWGYKMWFGVRYK